MKTYLEEHLGRALTAADLAKYLNCDITTIYKNYEKLGGIKLGPSYRFLEKSLIDAILGQKERKVDRTSQDSKQKIQINSTKQVFSQEVGSRKTKINGNQSDLSADPHSLLT